jgi:hypothetical protein
MLEAETNTWLILFRTTVAIDSLAEIWKLAPQADELPVTDELINETDILLKWLRKDRKIVASFDHNRKSDSETQIIIYGNYPNMPNNLLFHNPCYRHVKYFAQVQHDRTESHAA